MGNQADNAMVVRDRDTESLSLKQVTQRVNLVHDILKKVMKQDTHFGTVPGCGKKMVLFKPGADLLAMTFRLCPRYETTLRDLENGHREYTVTCSMYSAGGDLLGQGVGCASTMEKKYRYRWENDVRVENEDIADVYNTVLKIAKKRAGIDATLTVTGAADLFTQDLIDEDPAADGSTAGKPGVAMPEETTTPTAGKTATGAPTAGAGADFVMADGMMVTVGQISAVSSKPSGRKGGTRYACKVEDVWYSTFDHDVGAKALALKGVPVVYLVWVADGDFRNLVRVSTTDPQAPAKAKAGKAAAAATSKPEEKEPSDADDSAAVDVDPKRVKVCQRIAACELQFAPEAVASFRERVDIDAGAALEDITDKALAALLALYDKEMKG